VTAICKEKEILLSQEKLKKVLHYNPDTGIFTWLISCKRIKAGDRAGTTSFYRYIYININKKSYLAHRLAWLYMKGVWPKGQIDHENHIRDDNRWSNLYGKTQVENLKNKSKYRNNVSGVTGVHWVNSLKRWRASIKQESKQIHLGQFIDKFEAICCRKSASNKYGFHENHGQIKR